jgi:hypothetical protein
MCLKIKEELHAQPWISYTTDVWTSPNMVPFMSITAHWIDEEWNKREVLIAFEEIRGIHTGGFSIHYSNGNRSTNLFLCIKGENLAKAFVEVLESYDILHTLFIITCDNASNMVKMAKEIEAMAEDKPEISFVAEMHRIPCIGHIINLAVQRFLKAGLVMWPMRTLVKLSQTKQGKTV